MAISIKIGLTQTQIMRGVFHSAVGFGWGTESSPCLPSSLQGLGCLDSGRLEAKGGNVEIPRAQAASSVASECLLDPISFLQRRARSLQPAGYHLTAGPSLLP